MWMCFCKSLCAFWVDGSCWHSLWQINWLHSPLSWHLAPMSTLCVLFVSSLEIITLKKKSDLKHLSFFIKSPTSHQIPLPLIRGSPSGQSTAEKCEILCGPGTRAAGWLGLSSATWIRNRRKDCKQRVMINDDVASGWEVFSGCSQVVMGQFPQHPYWWGGRRGKHHQPVH